MSYIDDEAKASEKQLAANRLNAAKSTGPRTEKGKARRHGLAITLPKDQKAWDDLDKHTLAEIEKRLLQIEREHFRAVKLTNELIEKTTPDEVERAIRRLANHGPASARTYTSLKKEIK